MSSRCSKRRAVHQNSRCSGENSRMREIISGCSLRVVILAEHAHEKQQRTNDNGAIGNIEWRPVMHAYIEIQKVRDIAGKDAVPQIARGTAQKQRSLIPAGVKDAAIFP